MIWASHTAVGLSMAKIFELNYSMVALGSILPDLMEFLAVKRLPHRGITHSIMIWSFLLVIFWKTNTIKDVLLGVMVGHILMDSLTVMGVPLWDEKGRKLTLFGGKIRTKSVSEFVLVGTIVFISFLFLETLKIGKKEDKQDWLKLYQKGIIDKKEYKENRFKFF